MGLISGREERRRSGRLVKPAIAAGLVLAIALPLTSAGGAPGGGGIMLSGTPGADRLIGTMGGDHIAGRGGPDLIIGRRGDDVLRGGPGADVIRGDREIDLIGGGAGNDLIRARDHRQDSIDCGPGRDVAIVDRAENGVYGCETLVQPDSGQRVR